jgi:hypothetical protein
MLVRFLERRQLRLGLLVGGARRALRPVKPLLHRGQVRQRQLELDYLAVAHRVHRAHHVRDIGILEAAHHVHDGVRLADVREELVAKPFALRRALHEPGDVNELHHRRHGFPWFDDVGNAVQTRVGHFYHPDVRLDGAERVVLGGGARGCQCVEKRGLPHVGKTDDSELQHRGKLVGSRIPAGRTAPFAAPPDPVFPPMRARISHLRAAARR